MAKKYNKISSLSSLDLWDHQKKAIELIYKYHESGVNEFALVKMPTGTGKTRIIATISQFYKNIKSVLIICPSEYLTKQLGRDVSKSFFSDTFASADKTILKKAEVFVPSTLENILKKIGDEDFILLCTTQTLQLLYTNNRPLYLKLKKKIDLVLVDEGHREPAKKWADAIDSLKKPSVLFSATPYRNDFRLFRINKDYVFRLSYQEAVQNNIIRSVEFENSKAEKDHESFVNDLLKFYNGKFKTKNPTAKDNRRVIIRCSTSDDIKTIHDLLDKKGLSVISIHENFSNKDKGFYRNVPNPKDETADFWIHQNKLNEGFDDSRFSLLAIFQPDANTRSLVQQIGRIIRNPERKDNQKAFVFSQEDFRLQGRWETYLRYEEKTKDNFRLASPENIVNDLTALQEDYSYLEGTFREKFNPEDEKFYEHLCFKKSANIFKTLSSFDFSKLKKSIKQTIKDEHLYLNEATPDDNTHVVLFAKVEPSPIIDQSFLEINLCYMISIKKDDHVFFSSSTGMLPTYLSEETARVEPELLEKLLSDAKTRISQVSLLNSDLGMYSVRRKTMSAYSIEQVSPGLSDHSQFCSTARGIIETSPNDKTNRYLGFTRGRISDQASKFVFYDEYLKWVDSINDKLKIKKASLNILGRYAKLIKSPSDTEAKNILFDLDDVLEEFQPEDSSLFDDVCFDIKGSKFECVINDVSETVSIDFDTKTGRYKLTSSKLEKIKNQKGSGGVRSNLLSYLNSQQSFRIITSKNKLYSHGVFSEPRFPLWGRDANKIDLTDILITDANFNKITSEKGKNVNTKDLTWETNSLFEYIDVVNSPSIFDSMDFTPDYLFCGDMGKEVADFFAADLTRKKICMIHAKTYKDNTQISATAFQDVCGQAVKNLGFLIPFNEFRLPQNLSSPWTADKTKGSLNRLRMPKAGKTIDEVYDEMRDMVNNPTTKREVWVALSRGFMIDKFNKEREKSKPKASSIQVFYLLQSTWNAVSSIGASLKIICRP